MSKLIKTFLFTATIAILLFSGKLVKATDFENWTFVGGETKIKNMEFSFHSANFFNGGSNYFLNHTQMTLEFPSKGNIYFGIGYKQEYVEFEGRNDWRSECRPMLHLFYEKDWGYLNFRDRSRWEFRFMDGEFINRYRNQVQFAYTKFKRIIPYFSTEFSFYFNKLDYTRQRTVLGAEIPIKSINLNLFVGHQINEDFPETWNNLIMMGTGVSYSF